MSGAGAVTSISFEEAEAILDAMVAAEGEGLLRDDSARLALRLIEHFGEEVLESGARGWFPEALRRIVK